VSGQLTAEVDSPTEPGGAKAIAPGTRNGWLLVGAIVAVALIVRVAYVIATRHSYRPMTDAADFDLIATSLAHGHGFGSALVPPAVGPTSYRGPLYPLALSVVYAVFGHSWTLGRMEEAVFGTVLVLLIGIVSAELFDRRVATVTMAIAAVYPTLILFGTSLQLEPLLAMVSTAALAAALEHRRAPRGLLWPITSGVLIALSIETREWGVALILPVAWLVWTAQKDGKDKRWTMTALAAPIAVLGVTVVCLLPWTIRNEVRLHTFAPSSTSAGFTLAGTYNATSAADPHYPTLWRPPYYDPTDAKILLSKPNPSEVWVDSQMEKAAFDYIKAHPTYVFRVLYWNTVGLFDLDGTHIAFKDAPYIPYSLRFTRLAIYSSYVMELLAIASFALARTRKVSKAIWVIPITTFFMIIALTGNIRYRAAIEPYTVLLAGGTVAAVIDRVKDRTKLGAAIS